MVDWTVPLADVIVDDADLQAVVDTYRSGWLSMGPRIEEFEASFAEYVGVRHAIAVSSGTAALHLMCLASGIGPGDEVVVPSMTFVATVNAVRYAGATPVFADIAGPLEPWLSAQTCAAAMSPRTKAILYVAYGGHAGELAGVAALAECEGIALLQDAAHAAGTRLDGVALGSIGSASAFSFFSNKNLAIGEGGMVATDDDRVAADVRLLRSHGMTTVSWDRHRGHAAGYDVVALGFNYRMDEPRAALGRCRLERLEAENARRAELDARYRAQLITAVACAMPPADGVQPAHHIFTIVLRDGADRDAFRDALRLEGVQTSVHYPPAHRFSIHARGAPELPLTDAYATSTVTLPLFAHMTHAQQDHVVAAVAAAHAPTGA
ncbi:MAG TPA: DegT/DnrJ/EryC1/StrS family aminotransferase [Solirubrobacteraceae bacterium]|nr:DegT/DnrJ/EryC1/StrS family aminotransferase [Solirubrobacteraceae bacterium]